jgi:thiol:disulfide interchange protein
MRIEFLKRCRFGLLALVGFLGVFSLNAQQIEQPTWSYSFSKTEVQTGEIVELILTATPPRNWYIYSTNVVCEIGPIKAALILEKHASYQLVGNLYSVGDKKEIDDIFSCQVGKFEKKAELRQKIKLLAVNPQIKGFVEGQMCNNTTGLCVSLESKDIVFSGLNVKGAALPSQEPKDSEPAKQSFITPPVSEGAGSIDCNDYRKLLDKIELLYGSKSENIIQNNEPFVAKETYKSEGDNAKGTCVPQTYEGEISGVPKSSMFGFFLLAFLSGLAALITPCVFPMIPMTVAFFMKGGTVQTRRKGILNGLLFGGSIIFIYTFVGSFFGAVFGPDAANFLSTHWIPNVFFFLVFVFFAAAFFGAFELVLPSWLVNKVDKQADKGGFIGIFFMALTLALVSFSCTGPIVGMVIVESISGNFMKPIIGMFGFSLAFALPFTLFAMFPTWLKSLPKGGGWLNTVKVVLGFLELALGLKFLSLADQTYHWGILDREVYIALWIVIFTLMGLYLIGKLKFAHDSDFNFLKVPRLLFAVITFSFVMYLLPGMFGAPLKALAGYLPPMSTHDFALLDKMSGPRGVLCEEPKYADKLHLPHNLKGYFDYEQGMACAKKLNKPVFIDFTGHGCVNCREMEARVWSDQRVLDILSNDYVVIALYVDDKELLLPESEQYVSKISGRKVTTVSKMNADIQSCMFGTNAQPNYVLLDNEEKLLNFPSSYDLNVENFIRFLKTGIRNYKKQQAEKLNAVNP